MADGSLVNQITKIKISTGRRGLPGEVGPAGPVGLQGENGSPIPHSLQCAEQILEGMWISIVDINGISKIKKASAATGELVDGYVLSTYEQDFIGTFYMAGENTKAISISNGIVYLSHTTPGRETTEQPPEGYGYYLQKIGKSIGGGIVLLDKGIPIKLN